MPKISIIILTYNSINFIKSCLDSIFIQNFAQPEIIVVDNNSNDGTVSFVKKEYPQIKIIENKNNLGAARARNQGIEMASGDWILTLDCDTILKDNFLDKVTEAIKILPCDIGIIQPKIFKSDRKTIYSNGIALSFLRRFYDIDRDKIDVASSESKYIFGACSASAIYRRKMLEEIKESTGYFDERFFFLVEDVDLAWRAQRSGWKSIFFPEAVSYHFGNSSKFNKGFRRNLCIRNRFLLIKKNERLSGKIKLVPFFCVYDLPRLLLYNCSKTTIGDKYD